MCVMNNNNYFLKYCTLKQLHVMIVCMPKHCLPISRKTWVIYISVLPMQKLLAKISNFPGFNFYFVHPIEYPTN